MAQLHSLHIGLDEVDSRQYVDASGAPWSGRLSAAVADATAMQALARTAGASDPLLLRDAEATVAGVWEALLRKRQQAVAGDLVLVTYAGHGSFVADTSNDEPDARDETWCLYDGQLRDDDIRVALATFGPGTRIVVFSDSCHSGTVLRIAPVSANELADRRSAHARTQRASQLNPRWADPRAVHAPAIEFGAPQVVPPKEPSLMASVLHFGACQDDETAAEDDSQGVFTAAVLNAMPSASSHRHLNDMLRHRVAGQRPSFVRYGAEDPVFERSVPLRP